MAGQVYSGNKVLQAAAESPPAHLYTSPTSGRAGKGTPQQ